MKKFLKSYQIFLWFLLVFVVVALTAYFFQFNKNTTYYTGEDSFYHIGMAKLMMNQGIFVQHFPYLNFTVINDQFVNSHYLFHLILIPFIKIFGEVVGPKILVILLLAASFGIVYLIFRERKLKLAPLYAILLFFVMPEHFYLRMSFIRDPVFSLFLMLLAILFLLQKKPWALFVTMLVYAWSYYVGAVLIFALFFAYLVTPFFSGKKPEKLDYKLILFGFLGFLVGLVVNPYFPKNLIFFYIQAFSAGFSTGDFWGSEHAPYDAWYWFTSSFSVIILFFAGITFSLIKKLKQDSFNIAFFLFSLFILVLELKSRRFAEYWPLLGGMSGFLLCGKYLENTLAIRKFKITSEKIALGILIFLFVEIGVLGAIMSFKNLFKDLGTDPNTEGLKNISLYLKENSNPDDLVFNDSWSIFPYLFYFNQKNYYIVGLDPSFLELYDQKLFNEYYDLTFDNESVRNADVNLIKTDFKAKWLIVSPDHPTLLEKIKQKPENFEKVYENNGYTVFKVL